MNLMTRFERWEPFEELNFLRNRLNRTFSRFGTENEEELMATQWAPPADVFETKDAVVVKTELPGVSEKDIVIQIDNGVLSVQGERMFDKEAGDKEYRRIERAYGKFVRYFNLTPGIETKDITASFDAGVLEIRIPKKEEAKPKTIKVDVRKKLTT
jgi:HSP20 family protein